MLNKGIDNSIEDSYHHATLIVCVLQGKRYYRFVLTHLLSDKMSSLHCCMYLVLNVEQ